MKKLVISALFAVLFLFSSCSLQNSDIEDLLLLPQKDAFEKRVLNKLLEVEADDVALAFTLRGETQNAISFYDINGDGTDEVIVLYRSMKAHPKMGNTSNIHIFKVEGGVLTSLFDLVGYGSTIDKMAFADFNGDGISELVVGYVEAYEETSKMLYIYEFDFVNKRTYVVNRRYSDFVVTDINGDGNDDVVSVQIESLKELTYPIVFAYDYDQKCVKDYSVSDSVRLTYSPNMYQMISFKAENGKNAILITSRYKTMLMVNDILVWDEQKSSLINVSANENSGGYPIPYKYSEFCSLGDYIASDIDGDMAIEIPLYYFFDEEKAYQNLTSWQEVLIYLYGWYNFDGEKLVLDYCSYINDKQNYIFKVYDTEAFKDIKAYLDYKNDMFFYYVPNETATFPIFGIDNRILLFSIIQSEEPLKSEYETRLLYQSPQSGIYYTLVLNSLKEENKQYMPDVALLDDAFFATTVTTSG